MLGKECKLGKDLQGNTLPSGIMQRKSGIYRGRFYYKGETYTKDNADLKKLVQEMEDLRYEVKHGIKGMLLLMRGLMYGLIPIKSGA